MKLVQKAIALILVLVALSNIYNSHVFERQVSELADQYNQVKKIQNCDVIYVSASSNFPPTTIEEQDPRKISQFISDSFPHLRFEAINKPASHSGIYYPLLKMFDPEAEAKIFIITINLRTFGPDWIHSELETPLRQSSVFYNQRPPILNRFLVSLNAYDNKTTVERKDQLNDAWDNDPLPFPKPMHTVSSWCAQEKWGDWRDPKRQLADQFIKQYGFVIDESNVRVKDFDDICTLAIERQWTVVFNLLAENTETADSLVGDELVELMNKNANWLIKRYSDKGFTVVNNLNALSPARFTDKDFPTEHYDEFGRKIIAQNVADALALETNIR